MSKADAELNRHISGEGPPSHASSDSAIWTDAGEPPEGVVEELQPRKRWRRRVALLIAGALVLVGACAGVVAWEASTSTLQARFISDIAADLTYTVEPGPSPSIRFPESGPFDERLGYTSLPRFVDSLEARGFEVTAQARVSSRFAELVDRGLFPIYAEKLAGGLHITDTRGNVFHASPHPAQAYSAFDSIPEVLWRSLVFIENREFLDPERPRKNPAVEWDRLGRGVLEMVLRKLGSERSVPGGSTLATQLEKFRHSPEGLTSSPQDKLRQMASASLRAYQGGEETFEAQKGIVLAYLNSVPLAAQRGHGEVTGTADGLWAWYGTDFAQANRLLRGERLTFAERHARGRVYRQALSLLIAHRRPSFYLGQSTGREELNQLTEQHIRLLRGEGVIPAELAESALAARAEVLLTAPQRPMVPFVERKAAVQLRAALLPMLGIASQYELDRFDATVHATVDMDWQRAAEDVLRNMSDPEFLRANGFGDTRLLDGGNPASVLYSVTLLETTPLGNAVRVQTDSYDGPLSLSGAGRLELGSTAKLRTLASYLEVLEELHARFSAAPRDSLRGMSVPAQDRLTGWAVDYLLANPDATLEAMLGAGMGRTYSANPGERFATGGGVQTFSNFDNTYNQRVMSVTEGFRQSVNLVSVRTMRDVVQYYMYRSPRSTARILADADDPGRQEYLELFADEEGSNFLRQFYRKYQGRSGPDLLEILVNERSLSPQRVAWAYRTAAPEATLETFREFLVSHTPNTGLTEGAVEDLYTRSDPDPHPLQDLGYLARIHPLELWLVRYLLQNPQAEMSEILEASKQARQDVYTWLFRTRFRNAQDNRIRTMIELEAFQDIHERWQRLGYPFNNIVPSYGTAIGSSGDRPLALAELVGIILNDGVRYPIRRVEAIEFAEGTPFETRLRRLPAQSERVMSPAVAAVLRDALVDVVENGTGRRVRGALLAADGTPLVVGGKTGTGDNRFNVYAPGGRLLQSRAVNRTATFAFFAGDRYFGVVTAYVPGEEADDFRYTSALSSQILKVLAPRLDGLVPVADDGPGEALEAAGAG